MLKQTKMLRMLKQSEISRMFKQSNILRMLRLYKKKLKCFKCQKVLTGNF